MAGPTSNHLRDPAEIDAGAGTGDGVLGLDLRRSAPAHPYEIEWVSTRSWRNGSEWRRRVSTAWQEPESCLAPSKWAGAT